MIKAVLFDMGGTLMVSDHPEGRDIAYAARLLEQLSGYGFSLDTDPASLSALLHRNAEDYKHHTEQTKRELPGDQIWSEWYLRQFHLSREALAPYAEELSFAYDYERIRNLRRPHLCETIHALKGLGLRLGVISNVISYSVMPHFLAEYGIAEDMDCVILSSRTGYRKPDPENFRIAEKSLNLRPEELAYVGDTISRDVIGCRNAGWKLMIQIRNPSIAFRDAGLENCGIVPDYRIDDLSEIPEIIQKENLKLNDN